MLVVWGILYLLHVGVEVHIGLVYDTTRVEGVSAEQSGVLPAPIAESSKYSIFLSLPPSLYRPYLSPRRAGEWGLQTAPKWCL